MNYYAHFGHRDFILCLGYRGDLIREFFLHYNEAMSNDFTLYEGGRRRELHGSDIADWNITFVDTGLHSNIGQRLLRVKKYLAAENEFLANYSDGLANVPLDRMIADFRTKQATASFVSVRSPQSFNTVQATPEGAVTAVGAVHDPDIRINGGFFVLRKEIFDYVREGESGGTAVRATHRGAQARTFPWDGFCSAWIRSRTRSPSTAWRRRGLP
jgi:glucose-1-phosphate cytidylyltransferase